MKRIAKICRARFALVVLCALCTLSLLSACGPKDIGEGSSSDAARSGHNPPAEENLRYPVTGASNTQRMLYYMNQPNVMSQMQDMRMQQFRRHMGAAPSPEDPAYRAVPKQRSPFRQ